MVRLFASTGDDYLEILLNSAYAKSGRAVRCPAMSLCSALKARAFPPRAPESLMIPIFGLPRRKLYATRN